MSQLRAKLMVSHVLLLCLTAASCNGDGEWTLLRAGDPNDPRSEQLRRRLDVRVNVPVEDCESTPDGGAVCRPDVFLAHVYDGCEDSVPAGWVASACNTDARSAHILLCTAETLLQVVQSITADEVNFGSNDGPAPIPPQDLPTQAELSRRAMYLALQAAMKSLGALSDESCTPELLAAAAGTTSGSGLADLTQGDNLAGLARQSYHVIRDAAQETVRASMASADAQRSETTDAAAAEAIELAAFASRASAAHTLLGGDHGLPALSGVSEAGFFPRPRLSDQGQLALGYFRTAAIDPARILDEGLGIDAVVFSQDDLTKFSNSLHSRLGFMLPDSELFEASDAQEVYRRLGISRDAFVEARTYLALEFRAFDRSPQHRLAPESLPNGDLTNAAVASGGPFEGMEVTLYLFASVRNPPAQPAPLWWSSVIRYRPEYAAGYFESEPGWDWTGEGGAVEGYLYGGEDAVSAGDEYVMPSEDGYGAGTLSASLEIVVSRASDAMQRLVEIDPASEEVERARSTLAALLSDLGEGEVDDSRSLVPIGRARACVRGNPLSATAPIVTLDVSVHEDLMSESMLVVNTHDVLDCATRGLIEGAPCSAGDINKAVLSVDTSSSPMDEDDSLRIEFSRALSAWDSQEYLDGNGSARPTEGALSVYVLRLREGAPEGQPGSYEAVAGWILPEPEDADTDEWIYCDYSPLSPGIDAWARDIIAPNTDYPGDAFLSCAGIDQNFRLPLENELTDDGNGVESSWRHYLAMADEAANQADALGETLIQQGLEMDLRAEVAVDVLQEVCGVTLNVSPFQEIARAVAPEMSGECPAGYYRARPESLEDACIVDPVAYAIANAGDGPDAAQLATCLQQLDGSLGLVGLGDQHLCLWAVDGASCAQEEGAARRPCPFAIGEDTECPTHGDTEAFPPDADEQAVTTVLGLFHIPEDPQPPTPTPADFPCHALALSRSTSRTSFAGRLAFDTLLASGFLSYGEFARAARSLRFEASAGDFARVLYGNTVVFSTGSAESESTHWPMVTAPEDVALGTFSAPNAATAIASLDAWDGPLFGIPAMGTLAVSGVAGTEASSSTARQLRARLNDLLARSVLAAHVLGGASLEASRFPYYHPAANGLGFEGGAFSIVGDDSPLFQSATGRLYIDLFDDDLAGGGLHDIADWRAVAQAINAGPEWLHCHYDRSAACDVFSADDDTQANGVTEIEATGTQLPLFLRTLDADVAFEGGVDARTARFWGEGTRRNRRGSTVFTLLDQDTLSETGWMERTTVDGPVGLDSLSRYYTADYEANQAYVSADGGGLTDRDLVNALELACLASRLDAGHPDPITAGCDEPFVFTSVGSVLDSGDYLTCVAERAEAAGGLSVLRGLPAIVVDAIRQGGASVDSGASGEVGAQLRDIQAALVELRDEQYGIADDIRAYGNVLTQTRNTVRIHQIGAEIREIQLSAALADSVTQCIVASASAAATVMNSGYMAGGVAGAEAVAVGATCANGVFQQMQRERVNVLEAQEGALEIESALAEADTQFTRSAGSIRTHSIAIAAAIARIEGALTRMRAAQARGRDALARALYLDSPETARHFAADTAMRNRYDVTLHRYLEAFDRSVRLAHIARISLEQRLAVHLSEMQEDLLTVPAPARWADQLCSITPVDYERLRESADPDENAGILTPDWYTGLTVGDYVRRLEQVFESYSFAYPFQDGTDTVIVSMRDDLFHLTRTCTQEVPNLLYQSGALDSRVSSTRPGWGDRGCDTEEEGFCTLVTRPDGVRPPAGVWGDLLGPPAVTRLTFGPQAVETTRLSQFVALGPGRYRLSWYAYAPSDVDEDHAIKASSALRVLDEDGDIMPLVSDGILPVARAQGGMSEWTRYDYFVDVESTMTAEVAVLPHADILDGAALVVAGVQLVRASAIFSGDVAAALPGSELGIATRFDPGAFYATNDTRVQEVDGCPDDGTEFRRRVFARTCVPVCIAGYGSVCTDEDVGSRCAWQASFDMSSDRLERILTGEPAGFAAGNFNYRFESVAVNLVGTGLRDCSADGRSGCFASGNASFSLLHRGPFLVRDYSGGIYSSPLFPGRIENARALAAERYLTNPISGADTGLIQSYVRGEFRGRPLGGTIVLQLWDDSTFAYNRLEDVQLSVTYRYWQRQR
jgi:hypothetical protein